MRQFFIKKGTAEQVRRPSVGGGYKTRRMEAPLCLYAPIMNRVHLGVIEYHPDGNSKLAYFSIKSKSHGRVRPWTLVGRDGLIKSHNNVPE